MDRNTALAIVKEQLTERRYEHTIRVTDTALELAEKFGTDRDKTELAGILHDYAKYRSKEEMQAVIEREEGLPDELLSFNIELWHAPVGAVLVEEEVGITDSDILRAIRYHTTGRSGMTLLEKIIFIADYIEPGRSFPGVEQVRELVEVDLDAAIVRALSNTVTFLMKKKQKVYPDTFSAYNSLV